MIPAGTCPKCGHRVMEFPISNTKPAVSRKQFAELSLTEQKVISSFGRPYLFSGIWFLASMIAIIFFRDTIHEFCIQNNIAVLFDIFFWGMFLPFIVVSIILIIKLERIRSRFPKCGDCRFHLYESKKIIQLTGRCPKCAALVLDENDLPKRDLQKRMLDIEKFHEASKTAIQRAQRPIYLSLFWIAFVIGIGVTISISFPGFNDYINDKFGPILLILIQCTLMTAFVLIATIPCYIALSRLSRICNSGYASVAGPCCPNCGKGLGNSGLCIASKRCEHCREVIFADPDGVAIV